MLKRFFYNLTHWEKWPFKLIYFPLTFVWTWYMLRSRSYWFFSASNPTITFGGFEGEGKREMYDQLPVETYPKTIYLNPATLFDEALQSVKASGFTYPFVVKPDNGMMGLLFRIIDREDQFRKYHEVCPVNYIVQAFSDYPVELSIFYYRFPNEPSGTVSGFIMKEYLQVKGDGVNNLKTLIVNNPKSNGRMEEMESRHGQNFDMVLKRGETYFLSYAGNHNRGARFINLHREIDDKLVQFCNRLSNETNKFYYGRFDVKCRSVEALKKGQDFIILEFNGAGAEPNHIYDCGMTLFQAYGELLKHWKVLFQISRHNHRAGYRYWPTWKGWNYLRDAKRQMRLLKKKDLELGSL
jgi:hypothetical protein